MVYLDQDAIAPFPFWNLFQFSPAPTSQHLRYGAGSGCDGTSCRYPLPPLTQVLIVQVGSENIRVQIVPVGNIGQEELNS
jgi:hypothetical protein